MKTKLIQTKDYLLLIDEKAEIKQNNWYIDQSIKNFNHIKQMTFSKWGTKPTNCFKILAYHSRTKEAKELDLPLLPLVGLETEEGKIWKDDGIFVYLQNGKKYKKSELELWVENI